MAVDAAFLPRDVLLKIFSYCSYNDLAKSVQFVCSWWQDVSQEKWLWKHLRYQPYNTTKEEILNMLRISPQLRNINLVSVLVDREIYRVLVDSCPNLEILSVSWNAIYDVMEISVTRPMNSVKILKISRRETMLVDFDHLHKIFPNLEHLEFDVLFCRKKDLLCYLGKKQHSIHTLSMACCTADGHCVLPFLKLCTKLKNLSLRNLCEGVEELLLDDVQHLRNISSLTFHYSDVGMVSEFGTVFKFFPNIIDLQLYICTQTSGNLLRELSVNCPSLRELTVCYEWHGLGSVLQDYTLKQLCNLKSLTHLCIRFNAFITDSGVEQLKGIPQLTHLVLYDCERVSPQCVKVLSGFSKLQVLKFDLCNEQVIDLTTKDIKNPNLQIMFYNCNDFAGLECLRRQHMRVCLLGESY